MVIEVKQNGKFVKIPYITADVPVSEAPIDGKQYARQDATWSEIVIPEVDLTEVETNIAANTQAIAANTADIATLNSTVSNLPTAGSIVVTTDPRLTAATTTKAGLMSAADKVQLDSTLTATEIENKVNAAVSSVYRVKGTVASVANLPTTDVAVGDVWNIADNGANYVATNNNPVEWDKLSETVDLSPYMQTSTANSTFVKKSGDTITGNLLVNGSQIRISNSTSTVINTLFNGGSEIKCLPDSSQSLGLFYKTPDNSSQLGSIGAYTVGADAESYRMFMGWGSHAYILENSFAVSKNFIRYKNVPVALTNDNKNITVYRTDNSNAKAFHGPDGMGIIPLPTSNSTGIYWKNQDGTKTIASLSAFTVGDTLHYLAVNFGENATTLANTLRISNTEFKYKGDNIWHAGNDGAGSGLDADTVDGIQSERIIYGGNASGSTNFSEDLTSFNNITKSGFYRCNANPKLKLLVSIHHPDSPSDHILQIGTTYEQVLSKNSLNYRIKTRDKGWSEPRTVVDTSTVLTQAEYNALGSTVNSDGKIYFIKE